MRRAVWVVQILLALMFAGTGAMKVTVPKDRLVAGGMRWAQDYSPAAVRAIGAAEVAGAIGLVAPAATGILPWLTPLAALGLTAIMAGAVVTHVQRGEPHLPQIGLGLLAAAVAYVLRPRGDGQPLTSFIPPSM